MTFFEAKRYKIANAFMLAWPYGIVQIMSSYDFVKTNIDIGKKTIERNIYRHLLN